MPDLRRIQALVEGDDDRAVLEGLGKLGLLPERVEVAKRAKGGGNNVVVTEAAARALAGKSCITVLDLDHHPTPAALAQWVAAALHDRLPGPGSAVEVLTGADASERVPVLRVRTGDSETRAAVVAVGLVGDAELCASYALELFAIDDFLLRLARDQGIFDGISEVAPIPYATAMRKLDRTIEVLRESDGGAVRITKAKRVLFLLRAIADFRTAPASFAGRLIDVAAQKADGNAVRAHFEPLVSDLEAAVTLLG
jgi:hypothetical protein